MKFSILIAAALGAIPMPLYAQLPIITINRPVMPFGRLATSFLRLADPYGVALDAVGNLFIAD